MSRPAPGGAGDGTPYQTPTGSAPNSRPATPSGLPHEGSSATLRTMVDQSQATLSARGAALPEIAEKKPARGSPPPPPPPPTREMILEQADPALKPPKVNRRLKFIVKPMAIASTLLLIVLWATSLWIFGCNHNAQHRAYKLKIRVRDFDGGIVGQTLLSTLEGMRSPEMPGWEVTGGSLAEVTESVWDGTYWGALTVNAGASDALNRALADPAGDYDARAAITNYLTGARYFTTYSSYIRPAVGEALAATSAKLSAYAASQALSSGAGASDALAGVIAQAAGYREDDLAPIPFQSRVFINTFGVVVPNLATFFFNMIIMGVFTEAGVYSHPTTMWKLTRAKFVLKVVWCVLAALIMTSVNFSFREDYTYPAKNFFALWTDTLFYCWINFNIFGTILAYLPIKFIMYFVFPIIVTSVAAAVFPPELGDAFYNISYIFPSHAYWAIAITIWGKGCCNRLATYCPVVMAWVIATELVWLSGDWNLSRKSRLGAGVPLARKPSIVDSIFPEDPALDEIEPERTSTRVSQHSLRPHTSRQAKQ